MRRLFLCEDLHFLKLLRVEDDCLHMRDTLSRWMAGHGWGSFWISRRVENKLKQPYSALQVGDGALPMTRREELSPGRPPP